MFRTVPVVTKLVCFLSLHARLRVRLSTRHSLRPLLFLGVTDATTRARSCRENDELRPSLQINGSQCWESCLKFESDS